MRKILRQNKLTLIATDLTFSSYLRRFLFIVYYSSRFVFRRPLLSTVSNIFVLPFQKNVWLATAVFLILVFCLLHLSIKWEYQRGTMESATYWQQLNPNKPTISDNVFILLGAFTQQGKNIIFEGTVTKLDLEMPIILSISMYELS